MRNWLNLNSYQIAATAKLQSRMFREMCFFRFRLKLSGFLITVLLRKMQSVYSQRKVRTPEIKNCCYCRDVVNSYYSVMLLKLPRDLKTKSIKQKKEKREKRLFEEVHSLFLAVKTVENKTLLQGWLSSCFGAFDYMTCTSRFCQPHFR